MISHEKKKLLGELLLEKNLITQEQLEIALQKQKEMGKVLGIVLEKLGYIEQESEILPIVAEQQHVAYLPLQRTDIQSQAIEKVPVAVARRYQVMPIQIHNEILTLAMMKPYDVLLCDELKLLLNLDIKPVLSGEQEITESIGKYYGVGTDAIDQILDRSDFEIYLNKQEVFNLEDFESEATIVNFLNQILLDAYHKSATDIHIEPFENKLSIRYRVDGILQDVSLPENVHYFKEIIISRIKIMTNLDISEKRLPQDGRCRVSIGDINLNLRVSVIPTPYGESVVIRVLNSAKLFQFDELDLNEEERSLLRHLISQPNGIIFMTGPTGSGKTTTLYSCLSKINTIDHKIITIEDPVEYQLEGIVQIQINSKIDFSFARGLRSILRHDPDVIMVGEVRDVETAEIAIQVALTGHLVFSTLHTNDAASGVTRLINMGIEPFLITSTVQCFIAQRLIRLLCQKCKKPRPMDPELVKKFDPESQITQPMIVYDTCGCENCHFTGYKGRTGIYEFLVLTDEVCKMILDRSNAAEIKQQAILSGMKTLRQSGWEKVKLGLTSPEEVIRVTQERSKRNH